ncbi:MAG: zinc ribbon domain-containing protein [Candidatus Korarchaeota archaeon]
MSGEVYLIKCPSCGAPWQPSPEDIVYTCASCGYTVDLRSNEQISQHGILPSVGIDSVKNSCISFLDKNKSVIRSLPQEAQILEISSIYVPFWFVYFAADSTYHGYKTVQVPVTRTVTRRDSSGRTYTTTETEYRTAYEPVNGRIQEAGIQPVLARYHSSLYGYEYFVRSVAFQKPVMFNINEIKKHKAMLLNSELPIATAIARAKNVIYDRHRKNAKSKCTELFDVRTNINIQGGMYVHAPYWIINYEFKRKKYSIAVDGTCGRVLVGKIPITFSRRAVNFILALFGLVIGLNSLRASQFVNDALSSTLDPDFAGFLALIVMGMFMIAGIVIIVKAMNTVFATELEKKG